MLCTSVWGLSHGWHPRGAPSIWSQECLGTRGMPSNLASLPAGSHPLGNMEGHRGSCYWGQGPPSSFGQLVSFHLSSISGGPAVYPLIFTIALLGGGT